MHSFASALIAAALATLSSAAPAGLPTASLTVSVSGSLPNGIPSVPLPTGTIPAGEVIPVAPFQSKVSDVHTRAPTLSVAAIFTDLQTEIQPYTEQMTYLTPSNGTINEITNLVSPIKASITAAVPQLEALVGQDDNVILASADPAAGDAELNASQIATIIGGLVDVALGAAGAALDVTNAKGGDNVGDVKGVLTDLGGAVTSLVGAAVPLVSGLSPSLAPMAAPVHPVMSDLNLGDLAIYLGLIVD